MSKTRAEVQFHVLAIITGGDVGAVPSPEDASTIDKYYVLALAILAAKKIIYIADPDDLDDELFEAICQYVANNSQNEFAGKTDPAIARYYENEIRVITAQPPGYGPQETCYF